MATGTNRPLCTAVLVLYVAGALLLPALHRCFPVCACADSMRGLSQRCCPCSHTHGTHTPDADDQNDSKPDGPSHDPSTCVICQLANIPIHTADVAVTLPQGGPVAIALPVAVRKPDIRIPRFYPFSCGPPEACGQSPHCKFIS